jgi:hypothetical protein
MDFLSTYLGLLSLQNNERIAADARNFQQRILDKADEKIKAKEEADALEKKELKDSGEAGRPAKLANLLSEYKTGYTSLKSGKQALDDYYREHGLSRATLNEDYKALDAESLVYEPKRKEQKVRSLFQNVYNRAPTEEELKDYIDPLTGKLSIDPNYDIKATLESKDEYKKSIPANAFQAEMEARYVRPVFTTADDPKGADWRTGEYKFNIAKGPTLSKDISTKTGITTPDFITEGSITGSPEELELAKSRLSSYESFVYNSGLKSLEGSISMELDKQQNESKSRLTREQGSQNLLQGLVGAFNFS